MSETTPVFDENTLYMPAEDPDIFDAEIVPTSASERCNILGVYELHVNTANLALVDRATRKPVYTWPFRYIRRYGRADTSFQFEAGRRCPSGEGLFSMKMEQGKGQEVFECIEARISLMKERDREYQNENVTRYIEPPTAASAAAASALSKPAVPTRQHTRSSYQNVTVASGEPAAASGGEKSKPPATKPSSGGEKKSKPPATKPSGGSEKTTKVTPSPAKAAAGPPPAKPSAKPSAPVPDDATYSEVYGGGGGGAYSLVDDQPPVYAAVVKKPAASRPFAGGSSAAAPPSDINRLIAEKREAIKRLDAEQTEGYGTGGANWATAGGSGGTFAEYGTVDSHPAVAQQYYLVTPTDDGLVDALYAEADSGGRPTARK